MVLLLVHIGFPQAIPPVNALVGLLTTLITDHLFLDESYDRRERQGRVTLPTNSVQNDPGHQPPTRLLPGSHQALWTDTPQD